MQNLIDIVYQYNFFEIDKEWFIRYKHTDENIETNISKIDIRVFKRILNIFTISDRHKSFRSNIETALQFEILKCLVSDKSKQSVELSKTINNIATEDLDKIWNLS